MSNTSTFQLPTSRPNNAPRLPSDNAGPRAISASHIFEFATSPSPQIPPRSARNARTAANHNCVPTPKHDVRNPRHKFGFGFSCENPSRHPVAPEELVRADMPIAARANAGASTKDIRRVLPGFRCAQKLNGNAAREVPTSIVTRNDAPATFSP
jgi:hypothetical protein